MRLPPGENNSVNNEKQSNNQYAEAAKKVLYFYNRTKYFYNIRGAYIANMKIL